jgi:hypothetical protein
MSTVTAFSPMTCFTISIIFSATRMYNYFLGLKMIHMYIYADDICSKLITIPLINCFVIFNLKVNSTFYVLYVYNIL